MIGVISCFVLHCGSVYCSLYACFCSWRVPYSLTVILHLRHGARIFLRGRSHPVVIAALGSRGPHLLSVLGTEATLNARAVCFGGELPPGAACLHNVNVLSRCGGSLAQRLCGVRFPCAGLTPRFASPVREQVAPGEEFLF